MMTRVVALLLVTGLAAVPTLASAHEGHDHKKPAVSMPDKASAAMEKASEKAEAMRKKMHDLEGPFEVGSMVGDFVLADTEGNEHRLSDYLAQGKTVVLEWFNPDCPFVKKHHKSNKSMAETFTLASEHGAVWLAINSGAPGKQGAGLEHNQKAREAYGIEYPLLLDESGKVGRMFGAKTTPHMFVISAEGTLLYAGAIDNEPNPMTLGKTNYVQEALHSLYKGKKIEKASTKPYGCSVKYGKTS